MVENTVKHEEVQNRPWKRRALVTVLLSMAALGAHHLHQRVLPAIANQATVAPAVAIETSITDIAGPNTLFGDQCTDPRMRATASIDLGENGLTLASSSTQAGMDGLSDSVLDQFDSAVLKPADATQSVVPTAANLSAVPEPATAAMLCMAIVPAISLRRPRSKTSAEKRTLFSLR